MASSTKKEGSKRSLGMTIAVGVLSVMMIVSMLLPSLSIIFSGGGKSEESTNDYPASVAEADAQYQPIAEQYEAQLKSEGESFELLQTLGNVYFEWANKVNALAGGSTAEIVAEESADGSASASSSEVSDAAHAQDLYRKAADTFDRALAIKDDPSAHTARILCRYYLGEKSEAIEELDAYAKESNYAPAWANLGMFYANAEDNEAAKNAFNKAIEADPKDELGSRSYAERYLSFLEQIEQIATSAEESAEASDASAEGSSAKSESTDAPSSEEGSAGSSEASKE